MKIHLEQTEKNMVVIKNYSDIKDREEISYFLAEIELIKLDLLSLWESWNSDEDKDEDSEQEETEEVEE